MDKDHGTLRVEMQNLREQITKTSIENSSLRANEVSLSLLNAAKVTCYFSKCVAENANQWFALTHMSPRTTPMIGAALLDLVGSAGEDGKVAPVWRLGTVV